MNGKTRNAGDPNMDVINVEVDEITRRLEEGNMGDFSFGGQMFAPDDKSKDIDNGNTSTGTAVIFNTDEGMTVNTVVFIKPIVQGMAIAYKGSRAKRLATKQKSSKISREENDKGKEISDD